MSKKLKSKLEKSIYRDIICRWWKGDIKATTSKLHGASIFCSKKLSNELDFLFEIVLELREMKSDEK